MDVTENTNSDVDRVTAAELRQFIERIERLKSDRADITQQIKEVKAEAKGRGYQVAVINELINVRAKNPDDVEEFEAILKMYREALSC